MTAGSLTQEYRHCWTAGQQSFVGVRNLVHLKRKMMFCLSYLSLFLLPLYILLSSPYFSHPLITLSDILSSLLGVQKIDMY